VQALERSQPVLPMGLGYVVRHVERNVTSELDVHLIVDNFSAHKHPKVRAWIAKRPRFDIHFTPTYASWLNQVERWFGLITQQAIRRGSFKTVGDLVRNIGRYIEHHNQRASLFVWTATADSILAKIERLSKVICGTAH